MLFRQAKSKVGLVLMALSMSACAPSISEQIVNPATNDSQSQPPSAPPLGAYKPEALSWESTRSEGKTWSEYVYRVLKEEAFSVLDLATDMDIFCPRYSQLSKDQKINTWGALFAAVAKFESGYSPTNRFQEPGMGTDPITGSPVYSEGLLQLSYQDTQWAPFCEFDWSQDKKLAASDPNKTILNPFKNLRCGILIMARQVNRNKKIVLSSGVYWSVLQAGGSNNKITSISSIVKQLSFCQ